MASAPHGEKSSGSTSTPEYLTMRNSYRLVISHIKAETGYICDALFEKGYIPPTVRDYVRMDTIPNEKKAQKLVDTLMDKVESNPSVYNGFVSILKSVGPWADSIVEQFDICFKTEQAVLATDCACPSESSTPDSEVILAKNTAKLYQANETNSEAKELHRLSSTPEAGFVCPYCKKCTVSQFFSKAGCPHEVQNCNTTSEFLFPYLNRPALTKNERFLLESRLMNDTRKIINLFADTEDSLIVSLESQNLNVGRLRNYVGYFMKKLGTKEELEVLKKSESLYDIFFALHPFKSFFHYEIIHSIVLRFGSDEDRQLMDEYISKFKEFCRRNVFEVPPNIFHDRDPKPEDKMFSIKFTPDEHKHALQLGDIVTVRTKLADILNVEVFALQLCCITDGCVCLKFSVSAHTAEEIFPLTQSQMSVLSENHIRVLDSPSPQENKSVLRELKQSQEVEDSIIINPEQQQLATSTCTEDVTTEILRSGSFLGSVLPKRSNSFTKNPRLKEGLLYKRQRGRKIHDLRGLKFQQRHCVLSSSTLAYYTKKDKDTDRKPKGSIQVAKIKIVERVPETTFKKKHTFQVGSEKEVIYFGASSERERNEWIETLKIAAFELQKSKPLSHYHLGAFGKLEKNVWSCCYRKGREAEGCELSTTPRKQSLSLDTGDTMKGLNMSSLGYANNSDLLRQDRQVAVEQDTYSDSEEDSDTDEAENPHSVMVVSKTWPSSYSLLSNDSGRGNSLYDLHKASPAPRRQSYSRIVQHSIFSLSTLTDEENTSLVSSSLISQSRTQTTANSQPSYPFTFTHKTTIGPGEGFSTLVLYRGTDSVITTTNTGKVLLISRLNTAKPQQQTIYTDTINEYPLTVSAQAKSFIIGSAKLYFGSLEEPSIIKCFEDIQDASHKLVALGPNGLLLFTSKSGSTVNMIVNATQNDWLNLKASANSNGIFHVPGQITSLTVSPDPKQPWLAISFTSLNDSTAESTGYVSIFNYETKECNKPDIETGQNSRVNLAFSTDGLHLYIGSNFRVQCFKTKSSKPAEFYYTFSEDVSVTSMCCSPFHHHLAVGLKSGAVEIFNEDPNQSFPFPYTITDENSDEAVTSLSYSSDGVNMAVAFQDGSIQVWKGCNPLKEGLLTRTGTLMVTSEGQIYHSREDGYTITIPEGAVDPGIVVCLHYGVAPDSPYGPYEFEDGAQPVSPIISLCPEPADTVFLKPIEVTLPHFIACRTPEDCQTLSFYNTQHESFHTENSAQFKMVTDGTVAHFSQYYRNGNQKVPQGAATLYTTHCCDLCIAKKYSEDDTSKAVLLLSQIVPKHPDFPHEYEIYYCLSYFLETCLQSVDEQYPVEQYDKQELIVSFSNESKMLLIQAFETLKGDWLLCTYPEQCQITEEDLCFWKDPSRYKIDKLTRSWMYPPKITLRVQPGEMVREGVTTTVSFSGVEGCHGEIQTRFNLELLPSQSPHDEEVPSRRVLTRSTSSTSTASTIEAYSSEAIVKFQDNFDKIAKSVNCRRLASALFSASSRNKCPYLDNSAIEVTKSFLVHARSSSSSDSFSTNFDILTDAYHIATRFPEYISAMQTALASALHKPLRDHLGYHSTSESLYQESTPTIMVIDDTLIQENLSDTELLHSHSSAHAESTSSTKLVALVKELDST